MYKATRWLLISIVIGAGILSTVIIYLINRPDCESESRTIPNSLDSMPDTLLNVPLHIVMASGESSRIYYDDTDIQAMVDYSNEIWAGAGINFSVLAIERITVPDWRAAPIQANGILCQFGKEFVARDFEDGIIDVIIVKDFFFADGGLTLNQGVIDAAFVEEVNLSEYGYRANWTLAHELGHTMNLVHSVGRDNMMFDSKAERILIDRPTNLRSDQIETARQWIYVNHCPALSCTK